MAVLLVEGQLHIECCHPTTIIKTATTERGNHILDDICVWRWSLCSLYHANSLLVALVAIGLYHHYYYDCAAEEVPELHRGSMERVAGGRAAHLPGIPPLRTTFYEKP